MTFLADFQYDMRDKFGENGFSGVLGTTTENLGRHPTFTEILFAETEYFLSIITSQGLLHVI